MTRVADPDELRAALAAAVRWLRAERVSAMAIGGLAVGILAQARATQDVDLLAAIPDDANANLATRAERFGIALRAADAWEFSTRSRMLLMTHRPTGVPIDIARAGGRFEAVALGRKLHRRIPGLQVPLPMPQDLVVMKMVARRPIDIADAAALLNAHPDMDCSEIRRWLAEFAEILDDPELQPEFERLLRRSQRQNP